ncbi:MAG: hypothetical protein ABEJ81_08570 [Haloferacaceae archaeon]
MPSTSRRRLLAGAAGLCVALAGCASGTTDAGEATESTDDAPTTGAASPTPFPAAGVDFPDGPTSPPDRPADLTAASVRRYVREYERRYAYNGLYDGPETEISLTCEVTSVEREGPGYRAVVACSGYADAPGTATGTGTPIVVHADWGSRPVTYLVSERTTVRRRGTGSGAGSGSATSQG